MVEELAQQHRRVSIPAKVHAQVSRLLLHALVVRIVLQYLQIHFEGVILLALLKVFFGFF
jgi:hypothetical protein